MLGITIWVLLGIDTYITYCSYQIYKNNNSSDIKVLQKKKHNSVKKSQNNEQLFPTPELITLFNEKSMKKY